MATPRYLTAEALRPFIGRNVEITRDFGINSPRFGKIEGRLLRIREYGPDAGVRIGGDLETDKGTSSIALDTVLDIRLLP